MRKSHNRAVLAARAAAANRPGATPGTVGTNPAARVQTPVLHCAGDTARRTRCAPMTGAQRNSEGRRSEWSASPYYANAVTRSAGWSDTVRTMPRGER